MTSPQPFSPTRSALRRAARTAAPLAAAATLAALVAGCGEEKGKPIPAGTASALIAELDQLQQRVDDGECSAAERGNLTRIDKRLKRLPNDVDADVRTQIEDAVDNLNELVESQCEQKPEPEPTQPAPTPTIPTTPPETQPTQPETEPTEPPEEKKPEENGKGKGEGNGGGGGGGGIEVDPKSGGAKSGGKKPKDGKG